ncbi:hypothetical protein ACMFMF_008008 [Clarireedia jacksonii]
MVSLKTSHVMVLTAIIAVVLASTHRTRVNFETDPILQVGEKSASSYAENNKIERADFETDPMLQVGEKSASSYAQNEDARRAIFETDLMLKVGEKVSSSYAKNRE